MSITPSGYEYGMEPYSSHPFWKTGEISEYVEFLTTSQVDTVKDNVKCTNYIINYLNHDSDEETLNIYVPFFDEYYTKSEIDEKNYVISSDLDNYYTKSQIDNKNFLTSSSLDDYYTKTEIDNKNYLVQSDLDNYYTKTQIDNKNFLTSSSLDNYYTKSEIDNKNYVVQSDLDNYYTKSYIQSNYYDRTTTINLINSIVDQKIGGVINGQY